MLDRIDVHCSWVSQSVLDLLPADLPDIPGGEIVHDPGMGVFCDNAIDVVMALWPRPAPATKAQQVRSAMASLNALGLVGMHDAGVTPANIELYAELADSEDWTVRVYGMLECDKRNSFCPEDARHITKENSKFTVRSVKLFAGTYYPTAQLPNPIIDLLTKARICRRSSRKLGKRYDRALHRS